MGKRVGPRMMEVLVEWIEQPSIESTWMYLQTLAGFRHWLGNFFAVGG